MKAYLNTCMGIYSRSTKVPLDLPHPDIWPNWFRVVTSW